MCSGKIATKSTLDFSQHFTAHRPVYTSGIWLVNPEAQDEQSYTLLSHWVCCTAGNRETSVTKLHLWSESMGVPGWFYSIRWSYTRVMFPISSYFLFQWVVGILSHFCPLILSIVVAVSPVVLVSQMGSLGLLQDLPQAPSLMFYICRYLHAIFIVMGECGGGGAT